MRKLYLVVSAIIIVLSGCASPAGINQMTAKTIEMSKISGDSSLKNNLAIKNICESAKSFFGNRELTTPLIKSGDYRQALERSLSSATLLAADQANAAYMLEVNLMDVKFLPNHDNDALVSITFDYEFLVTAEYTLVEKMTGKKVYSKTISTTFIATPSDSIFSYKRVEIAAEGAARANIEKVVDELLSLHILST